MAMAVMERVKGLQTFLSECVEELRKVTWPDADQLRNATFVVILFTIAISIVIWLMDMFVSFVIRSIMGMFGA
jgi:preprotein translocase SecE subunit